MDTPDIDDNISDIEAVDSQDEDQKIVPLNDNNDELNESR